MGSEEHRACRDLYQSAGKNQATPTQPKHSSSQSHRCQATPTAKAEADVSAVSAYLVSTAIRGLYVVVRLTLGVAVKYVSSTQRVKFAVRSGRPLSDPSHGASNPGSLPGQ